MPWVRAPGVQHTEMCLLLHPSPGRAQGAGLAAGHVGTAREIRGRQGLCHAESISRDQQSGPGLGKLCVPDTAGTAC